MGRPESVSSFSGFKPTPHFSQVSPIPGIRVGKPTEFREKGVGEEYLRERERLKDRKKERSIKRKARTRAPRSEPDHGSDNKPS